MKTAFSIQLCLTFLVCALAPWVIHADDPAPYVTTSSAANVPPLTVTSPVDWQVFQRATADAGTMHLSGKIPNNADIQWRLTGAPLTGTLPTVWQTIPTSLGSDDFAADVKVPAGGWYQLEVQAEHDHNVVAASTIEHVGVGEVFIIVGQSNSSNYGSDKQLTKTGLVSSFDGTLWHVGNDPQLGGDGTGGSFQPAFGDAIATDFKVPVGIISRGVGSTSVREWLPKGDKVDHVTTTGAGVTPDGTGHWQSNGVCFQRLATALAAVGPHGCRAILWHQGESDAGQARSGYPAAVQITGDEYVRYMTTLINASKQVAGWDVPWFTAQATYHSATDQMDPEFRAAQKAVWDAKLALEGPDTDKLGPDYRGTVHMNALGLQRHGQVWAEKVAPWLAAQTGQPINKSTADIPAMATPEQNAKRMAWWIDARFGMFIHWDMSSVAGTEISWSRKGSKPLDIFQDAAGYREDPVYDHLYEKFDPEQFDAAKWVQIAKDAGMKYIVFTAKHHGGFCMWDTKFTDYNIMHTPFHRDVVKELADACHAAGMRFGIYYSPRDWHQPDYGIGDNQKYVDYMNGELRELLTNYGKVDVLWFDSYGQGDIVNFWRIGKTWDLIQSLQPNIIINNRLAVLGDYNKQPEPYRGDFDTPEQKLGAFQNSRPWESCITLSAAGSWSYHPNENVRSLKECIQTLASCATGDGNMLLDVGPTPEGEIFPEEVSRLAEMGEWMKKCGESIYGTHGGPYTNKDKWGGSTYRGNTVYLHIFQWDGEKLVLPPLSAKVQKVANLSNPFGVPTIQQDANSLTLTLGSDQQDKIDTVIALTLSGPAKDEMDGDEPIAFGRSAPIEQSDSGGLSLSADQAKIEGGNARLETSGGTSDVGFWTDLSSLKWTAHITKPGTFTVKLTYSCDASSQGSKYAIKAGDQSLDGVVSATAGFNDYQTVAVGDITIAAARRLTIAFQPTIKPGLAVMNLQKVELIPKP